MEGIFDTCPGDAGMLPYSNATLFLDHYFEWAPEDLFNLKENSAIISEQTPYDVMLFFECLAGEDGIIEVAKYDIDGVGFIHTKATTSELSQYFNKQHEPKIVCILKKIFGGQCFSESGKVSTEVAIVNTDPSIMPYSDSDIEEEYSIYDIVQDHESNVKLKGVLDVMSIVMNVGFTAAFIFFSPLAATSYIALKAVREHADLLDGVCSSIREHADLLDGVCSPLYISVYGYDIPVNVCDLAEVALYGKAMLGIGGVKKIMSRWLPEGAGIATKLIIGTAVKANLKGIRHSQIEASYYLPYAAQVSSELAIDYLIPGAGEVAASCAKKFVGQYSKQIVKGMSSEEFSLDTVTKPFKKGTSAFVCELALPNRKENTFQSIAYGACISGSRNAINAISGYIESKDEDKIIEA